MYQLDLASCRKAVDQHPNWKDIWYGMNTTSNWGTLSYLYKKYGCPTDVQAFYNAYINDNEGDDIKAKGRTEEYFKRQAEILKTRTSTNEDIKVYEDYIANKLFVDTFNGMKWEERAKAILTDKGYIVKEPNYAQDTVEGIDKFIYKGDTLLGIVQVKPHTFFIGNHNQSLINDRITAFKNIYICKLKYNVPTYYIIYNKGKNEWVKNSKGGIAHNLKKLITADGISLNNIKP